MILDGFLGGIEGYHDLTRSDRRQFDLGVVKNPCQRVVVSRGDRIEFVIVTARTSHGQSEERPREGVHPIGQRLRPGLRRGLRVAAVRDVGGAHGEKAGGNCQIPVVRKEIARDLSPHELVIGQVAIQGANNPVPVTPRFGQLFGVEKSSQPVAVARDIQPVPSPVFAVLRRGKERVHDLGEGVWRRVGKKRRNRFGSGRQAGEIEVSPANENAFFRGGCGRQPGGLKPGEDKLVDRMTHPGRVLHRRRF